MTSQRINARLDDVLSAKLDEIRRVTRQTTTEVIYAAIERYHAMLGAESGQRAREVFSQTGFVGCAEGPTDLATAHKSYLTEALASKLDGSRVMDAPRKKRPRARR